MADIKKHDNKELVECQEQEQEHHPGTELITTLPAKAQRFIHLYLTGQYSISKIASLLEVHPNTVFGWMRKDEVKQIILEMQQTTHEMVSTQLKSLTMQAITRLRELTNSPIDGVALQAVKDVLDRAGHKSKQEIKIDKTVTTVEEKMKRLIDKTIDVEYEILEDEEDE